MDTRGGIEKPIVSVLLPTYRRAESGLFEKAVRSVLGQTLNNIELIIIDDASIDGTAQLIQSFMETDSRVSCIRHKYNVGLPAISEYEGVVKARGEYIAFIFDDNEWEKGYLKSTIEFMTHNHAKAAYGRLHSYYGKEEDEYYELGVASSWYGLHSLDLNNFIGNGAVILSKEVLFDERVGLYDPHVAATRLCDWGLWKRLVRYYEFFETGILAGKELGASQKDSLGNTYKMNVWCAFEREQSILRGELTPENFPDVEINKISERNTEFYQNAVRDFYRDFSKKKWYREEEWKIDKKLPMLRILVLATDYTATVNFSFLRLMYLGKSFVFRFGDENTTPDAVALADAVILARDLVGLEKLENFCFRLNIPCYYYTDDNYIELYNDYKEDKYFKLMKDILQTPRIKQFAGVFTSSPCLTDYFIEHKLNSNIFTLENCVDIENASKFRKTSNFYTIAFMGGTFRNETLRNVVIPALESLSEKYTIRMIYPEGIDMEPFQDKKLNLVSVKREKSLDLALKRYSQYEPDILIHCGPDIRNNIYKTLNALINAVQLGAVLVTSNWPPYSEEKLKNKAYYCAQNNSSDWFNILDSLISDVHLRETVYTCAEEYCLQRYNFQRGEEVLNKAFCELKPLSEYDMVCRLNSTVYDLFYGCTFRNDKEKVSRSLREAPLGFTGGIKKNKRYFIRCQRDSFSELGICFASFGEAEGNVNIGIWYKGERLRECTLDLGEYVHDNWTYVSFEPIQNSKNQIYVISLDFEYKENSALVGVFEDTTKKNFITKVANKLGYPLKVLDVLYVDCR